MSKSNFSHFESFLRNQNFARVHFYKKPELTVETITRVEAEALADTLVANMSPENLTCDGELSRAQVSARVAEIKGAAAYLGAMFPHLNPKWDDAGLFTTNQVRDVVAPALRPGDQFEIFSSKLGGRAVGTVIKVNRTRVRAQFAQGVFTVPFGMIKEIA